MPRKSQNSAAKPAHRPKRAANLETAGVAQDVVVRAMRLGDALASHMDRFFRDFGITTLQFNVMRILYVRDPDGRGLPSGSFAARLLRRVPDVPRLIDRLVNAGFLERIRSAEDRRVVRVRLTEKGTELVERITRPLFERDRKLLADVPVGDLPRMAADLERLLESVVANARAVEDASD